MAIDAQDVSSGKLILICNVITKWPNTLAIFFKMHTQGSSHYWHSDEHGSCTEQGQNKN